MNSAHTRGVGHASNGELDLLAPLVAPLCAGWAWHAVPVRSVATPPPLLEYAMPPAVAPSLLARLTGRRRHRQRRPEPADMGTAFGMEQWLDERDHGGSRAATAATTTTPTPNASNTTAAKRVWWPRWLQGDGAR